MDSGFRGSMARILIGESQRISPENAGELGEGSGTLGWKMSED